MQQVLAGLDGQPAALLARVNIGPGLNLGLGEIVQRRHEHRAAQAALSGVAEEGERLAGVFLLVRLQNVTAEGDVNDTRSVDEHLLGRRLDAHRLLVVLEGRLLIDLDVLADHGPRGRPVPGDPQRQGPAELDVRTARLRLALVLGRDERVQRLVAAEFASQDSGEDEIKEVAQGLLPRVSRKVPDDGEHKRILDGRGDRERPAGVEYGAVGHGGLDVVRKEAQARRQGRGERAGIHAGSGLGEHLGELPGLGGNLQIARRLQDRTTAHRRQDVVLDPIDAQPETDGKGRLVRRPEILTADLFGCFLKVVPRVDAAQQAPDPLPASPAEEHIGIDQQIAQARAGAGCSLDRDAVPGFLEVGVDRQARLLPGLRQRVPGGVARAGVQGDRSRAAGVRIEIRQPDRVRIHDDHEVLTAVLQAVHLGVAGGHRARGRQVVQHARPAGGQRDGTALPGVGRGLGQLQRAAVQLDRIIRLLGD